MKLLIALMVLGTISSAYGCVASSKDLQAENSISCTDESGTQILDFNYKSNKFEKFILSYEAEGCGSRAYAFSWVIFHKDGSVYKEIPVDLTMTTTPGEKQALRVRLSGLEACPYYGLSFGIQKI